jgi:isoquinoline 1-oxidoreductase beta subunit
VGDSHADAHIDTDNEAGIESGALGRRDFLFAGMAAGGGLLVGVGLPTKSRAAGMPETLTAWVSVSPDGTVSLLCGSQEMGQGIYSGLAQIVAEELRADWTQVVVGPAPLASAYNNPAYGAQITAGSASVRGYFPALLQAGAIARQMLIQAGARSLGVTAGKCIAMNGTVLDPASGRSVTFASVAAAAAKLTPPKSAPLYSRNGFTLVGQPVLRPEIPAKVTGATVYGLDVVVPGMVYGAVRLCPTRGGTVAKISHLPAGCQIVNLGTGIAAVMSPGANCTTWAAIQAAKATNVAWKIPANAAQQSTAAILTLAEGLLSIGTPIVAETMGNAAAAQASAASVLTLTYILPYLPHTTMEPPNCTASVTATSCEIWAPTQDPGGAQAAAAWITGLSLSQIRVHCVQMGGGLGRKLEQDFVSYAVMASKAVGRPVQIMFPREQDFTQDQYRPMAVCRATIGLDSAGGIVSWAYRNVSPSILGQRNLITPGQLDGQASEGSTALPYGLANRQIDWVQHPATIPVGFWRSVGNSINVFAVESAIDEAAHASKADPLAFRQLMLAGNGRALAVLNAAASLGGWGSLPRPGAARGIALHQSFGSLVACVVEVTQTASGIQLLNVACAVDCGMVINPDTAAQQVEGGIIQGLSSALWGQIQFRNGVAQTTNFTTYRLVKMADMPAIQVTFVQTPGAALGGVGEVGVPCVAPALANAWFALTKRRLRNLPLFPKA